MGETPMLRGLLTSIVSKNVRETTSWRAPVRNGKWLIIETQRPLCACLSAAARTNVGEGDESSAIAASRVSRSIDHSLSPAYPRVSGEGGGEGVSRAAHDPRLRFSFQTAAAAKR